MNLKNLSLLSAAGMLMTYTINVQAQCEIKYTVNSNWGTGATLSVDITNLGSPKTTWELAWNFSNAEKISQLWNGSYTQAGQAVRVKNASWNGNLSTNQTTNFGFNISMPSGTSLVKPAEFSLDGVKCVGKTSSSVSSSKSSTSMASSSRTSVSSSSNSSLASSKQSSSISSFSCNSQNVGDSAACASRSSLGGSSRSSNSSRSSSSYSSSHYSSSSSSTPVLANCSGNITYGPRLLRVLTRDEYINSVRDLLGVNLLTDLPASNLDLFLANTNINGFDNNTQETINRYVQGNFGRLAANVVTKAATTNFSGLINCSGLTVQQCADKFTTESLTRIFRRPANAMEIEQYTALFAGATTSEQLTATLGTALRTALSSPQFLYRQETGVAVSAIRAGNTSTSLPAQPIDSDAYVLTPYELASFLAFTFTGSTPDADLLNAAKNGALASDSQIEAQVDRLLNKAGARAHFGKFAEHWLGTEKVSNKTAPALFGEAFTDTVDKSLPIEMSEVFNHVVLDGAASFSTLFASNYSIINETLFNFYKLGSVYVNTDKFAKTNYPSHIRQGGLLTSGAFLASKSDYQQPVPQDLALAIRNRVLCQDVYGTTTLDAGPLRDNPFWQVGFAYQNLNSASNKISLDASGNPVNSAGVLTGVTSASDGITLAFNNAQDLAQKLSTLDATRYCFIEHNFRAAFGTGTKTFDPTKPGALSLSSAEQTDYACEKERLDYAMTSNGMSARAMLKRLGSLHAARYRKDRSQ